MLYSPKTKKNLLAVLIALFCYSDRVAADPMVEFNTDVLDASDRNNVDLKRFSSDNYVVPGNYLLDIRVNGQAVSQQNVIYRATANNADTSFVCLTPEQVDFLALKKEAQEKIHHVDPQCLDIKAIPGVELNNHEGILDITVPQAWMKYNDPDWVPPERWDDGVAGLVFDYSLSGQMTHQLKEGDSTHSLSAYGQTGFNAGAWRMRGEYQANYDNDGQHNLDWNQVYAYRPLPSLASKLTVGEIYLNSQVFDTVRFTGINMISDERMLPPSLQGYAPEIHGIAKSNAKVTVSQSGRVIYETTVPAGPFNIQDLRSSVRGTLDVKVEEQDGSVSTFQVNTANIPYLTRPGYVRYNTSIGKPSRYNHQLEGPAFYVGDFSWGISNAWSLYGGTMLTGNDYNAWSLGLGRDLNVLGALSADVTQSISRVPDQDSQKGMSFKLSYAKTFDEYNSAITFAGYRFSQKTFRSLSQYLDERYQKYDNVGREKEMYTITGNKTFWADNPDWATTMFLTYTHQNYWDRSGQDRYGITLGRSFRLAGVNGITANVSAWRSDYQGRRDDSFALSLSIPIGDSRWMGYDLQNSAGSTTQLASYSDNSDYNNLWRVRAGLGQNDRAAMDGYYQHRSQMAELNANLSYQQSRYVSVGGTMRGGFTATQYGAALHNSSATLDTARIMVDTSGIAGVPLNGKHAWTNSQGVAVVPDVVSYNSFDTRIDVDALDEDIEASKAISTTTLTEGAIGYQRFAVAQGEKMMALIRLADGSFPPFGSEIVNRDGVSVAMVMDNGMAWIAGVTPGEKLSANWNGKSQCQLKIPDHNLNSSKQLLLPCQ